MNERATGTTDTGQKGHEPARKNKRGPRHAEADRQSQPRQPEPRDPRPQLPEQPYAPGQPEQDEPAERRPNAPRERSDEDAIGRPVQLEE